MKNLAQHFLGFALLLMALYSCDDSEENGLTQIAQTPTYSYKIVDTRQTAFYNNQSEIAEPAGGESFYGQDAHYTGNQAFYTDNGDGTVSDNITGLIWSKALDMSKVSLVQAKAIADTMTLGGYQDWRVPTIKELYSLILFSGYTGSGEDFYTIPADAVPFIDTNYFDFAYGNIANQEERYIDAQWLSSTEYTSTTMNGDATLFGVNFADGRIKGYGYSNPQNPDGEKLFYARYVRGNIDYGNNLFVDNGDGTISDLATGLMWQQADDGSARNWQDALAYAENLELAGYTDWRLPNAKELQSIVDYTRSPDATASPAIDPLFDVTEITDPDGKSGQYPYFWSSTTHLDGPQNMKSSQAVYIAFGEAQGKMNDMLFDVHGAGTQRSDPKSGNISDYPQFFGPQGDVRYVYNYVRAVRNIE